MCDTKLLYDFLKITAFFQDTTKGGKNAVGRHEPCVIIAQCMTQQCRDGWKKEQKNCKHCRNPHELVWEYTDEDSQPPAQAFLDWASQLHVPATCLIHYLSGYDGHLLMRAAIDAGLLPETLNNGMRTYSMEIGRTTFKVGYNACQLTD